MPTPFRSFCLLVFCLFATSLSLSSAVADTHFDAGLAALQKSDLKTARTELQTSIAQNPSQAQVYYDLGLVEYKDNHAGLAIGLWRKALVLQPNDRTIEAALQFATKKLARPSIAHDAETYEAFRDAFLTPTPLWNFLLLANILLLFSGCLLLAYVGKRRRALLDEMPTPATPFLGGAFAILCLVFFALSLTKWLDLQTARATVIAPTLSVRTAPNEKAASLFDLFEGLEVVVQQASSDWLQVTYPGGLTGWVPKSSLIVTSGHAP